MLGHRQHSRVDMLSGPIPPAVLRFALPLMAANLLQLAFNAADVIVVGRFAGDDALAAVTSTTALINMLLNLTTGLSMGTNVIAARALGEKNVKKVRTIVHTSISLALLCGGILLLLGLTATRPILAWMGSPADVLPQSALYLRIYFLGTPATMLYNFGAALLRAGGDTRRPTSYLIIAGVLNAGLNLFFVIALHMGVAGVAWATAISKVLSGWLILRALLRESGPLHLDPRRLKLDGRMVGQTMRIGLPASIQGVVVSLSNVLIQTSVNSLGKAVMAGSGACANLEGFVWAAMNSFTMACMTFTSQNLGAKNLSRIDTVRRWSMTFAAATGLVLSFGAYLCARPLLGVYVSGAEALAAGLLRMRVVMLPYAILGLMDVIVGSQRGLGHSLPPMIVSLLGMCGFRILWIFTVFRADPSALSLFIGYPVSWVLTTTCQGIVLYLVRKKEFARVRSELEDGRLKTED